MVLGAVSAAGEARFYRSVVDNVNNHAGRYLLFFLVLSTGMWSSSTGMLTDSPYSCRGLTEMLVAFLPSSFAMLTNMMAFSYAFELPSRFNNSRTLLATAFFALGAIVGWPFSIAVAIPFVFEELFLYGKDKIKPEAQSAWFSSRVARLVQAGVLATLVIVCIPTVTPRKEKTDSLPDPSRRN